MSNGMKIVFMIGTLDIGGGQIMLKNLIKYIYKNNTIYVVVFGSKVNNSIESFIEEKCFVKYIDNGNLISFIKVSRFVKQIKPDIIHGHLTGNKFAALWSFFYKKKIVITMHTIPQKAFSKRIEGLVRYLISKKRCYCVAVSKMNQLLSIDYFNSKTVFYINNGIDINHYYQRAHEKFTFINVARQDENKNQILIIRAFKKIIDNVTNECNLLLVGDGPNHINLVKTVEELNLQKHVMIVGSVEDSANSLAAADVYIQSSYREGLPLSVLEAMAAHLPIISTNVGGMKDLVFDNGILLNDFEDKTMFEAMKFMIDHKRASKEMGKKSFEYVQQYSDVEMSKNYISLFEKVINNEE